MRNETHRDVSSPQKLGLKKNQRFQFDGQKSDAVYYISDEYVMKYYHGRTTTSNVSVNWLLDDECKIILM